MDRTEIGQLVAKRRAELAIKQEDLAELAGVTTKTIYQLESGKGNPAFTTLEKILQVLGLDIIITVKQMDL